MCLDCIQVPVMAFRVSIKRCLLALALTYIALLSCKFGKAEEDLAQASASAVDDDDPAQMVSKALLCFNDKFVCDIYSSCEESYRLKESGNLNVPPEHTDEYCSGSCLTETHLVLNCIDNILSNFLFYNKATIQDVRDTIKAGCGHGTQRGNFNVAEHIQAEKSNTHKTTIPILFALLSIIIIGNDLLLLL